MSSDTEIRLIQKNQQKIKDLFKCADYLSAWETDFLSSLRGRLDRSIPLSDKQQDVLDKLITKAAERFND